jgi:nicotinate-nucleotide adenylyltransferase
MGVRAIGRRIGVLGGTFDPVHDGHLLMARAAARRFDLDVVLFVPVGTPTHRDPSTVTDRVDRCEMVRIAIANERRFALSTVDVDRPSPTYTVDTLHDLRTAHGDGAQFFFLLGVDNLKHVLKWRHSDVLVGLATFVGVARCGAPLVDPGFPPGRLSLLPVRHHDLSSTRIRRWVRHERPVRRFVSIGVERYIRDHDLYRLDE